MAFVNILDVGHGSCVLLLTDDGKWWLFDCGHDGPMRPSAIVPGNTINRLFVLNYDEDHISDLPKLREKYAIDVVSYNPAITPLQLAALKLKGGPLSPAMCELLDVRGFYGSIGGATYVPVPEPSAEGVSVTRFWNAYGERDPARGTFDDTNNISQVVFLHTHGLHMVLPGDLEQAGWLSLLRNPSFRAELARVNVFVASHHGRESGYCAEVFDYCKPEIVVMSDGEKQFDTQEMASVYAANASGVVFDSGRRRKVLTTRCDGSLQFLASEERTTVKISSVEPEPTRLVDLLAPPPPTSPFSLAFGLGAAPASYEQSPWSLLESLAVGPMKCDR